MTMIDTTTILNGLIKIAKDNENGFRKVAEEVQDSKVQSLFLQGADDSKQMIDELTNIVAHLGATPVQEGSFLGTLHRGWIDIVSMLTQHSTYNILAECERGQDTIKAAYKKAVDMELPLDVKSVLQQQYDKIKTMHDKVRDLRDQYADAK